MKMEAFDDETLEFPFRIRFCGGCRLPPGDVRAPSSKIEFLAQTHDTVLIEEISGGRIRKLSLRDGTVRTHGLRWYECCETMLEMIAAFRGRWEKRRDVRLHRARVWNASLQRAQRQEPPAFICRLPSAIYQRSGSGF